jgi:hypothetical protein
MIYMVLDLHGMSILNHVHMHNIAINLSTIYQL